MADHHGASRLKRDQGMDVRSATSALDELENELDQLTKTPQEDASFVHGLRFNLCVTVLIVANSLQLGIEADYPEWEEFWSVTEYFFTIAFLAEMTVKLCVLKLRYFHDRWNCFDCVLVLVAVLDLWILVPLGADVDMQSASILRILRMVRLARIARLLKQTKRLSLILIGILDALRTTFWVGALVCVCIYACAIFCTEFIGKAGPTTYPGYTSVEEEIDHSDLVSEFNPYVSFGSMTRSMLTLFDIVIGAQWTEVVGPVSLKQPYLVFFFLGFSLLVTYGVMNVIIGMIVDSVMQNAREAEHQEEEEAIHMKLQQLAKIRKLVDELDLNKDGRVTVAEMRRNLRVPALQEMLSKVNLPICLSAEDLMALLDDDGDGTLLFDEIVRGLYRLIDSDSFQRQCMSQMAVNKVHERVKEHMRQTNEMHKSIMKLEAALTELRAEIRPPPSLDSKGRAPSNLQGCWGAESEFQDGTDYTANKAMIEALMVSLRGADAAGEARRNIEDSVSAMSARLEARIGQALAEVKALDAQNAQHASALCGSTFRDAVATYIEGLARDIESRCCDSLDEIAIRGDNREARCPRVRTECSGDGSELELRHAPHASQELCDKFEL